MRDPGPRAAWRITLDGWCLGWQASRAMPLLLLTTVAASILIEAADTYWGKPKGVALVSDAGPLLWSIVRALLKGCLAASTEIAVYRFVLLGEAADRPVWRTPARFRRYIAYGLALGGAFAVLLNAAPYVSFQHSSPLTILLWLAFGGLAMAALFRSVTLFRRIAAEASDRVTGWNDIRDHWWTLVRVFLWHMGLAMALAAVLGLAGSALPDWGFADGKLLSGHAAAVFQAVAGPYTFAGSFAVLYRSLTRHLGGDPVLAGIGVEARPSGWVRAQLPGWPAPARG